VQESLPSAARKTLGKIIALGKRAKKNTRQSLALGNLEKKHSAKKYVCQA